MLKTPNGNDHYKLAFARGLVLLTAELVPPLILRLGWFFLIFFLPCSPPQCLRIQW